MRAVSEKLRAMVMASGQGRGGGRAGRKGTRGPAGGVGSSVRGTRGVGGTGGTIRGGSGGTRGGGSGREAHTGANGGTGREPHVGANGEPCVGGETQTGDGSGASSGGGRDDLNTCTSVGAGTGQTGRTLLVQGVVRQEEWLVMVWLVA